MHLEPGRSAQSAVVLQVFVHRRSHVSQTRTQAVPQWQRSASSSALQLNIPHAAGDPLVPDVPPLVPEEARPEEEEEEEDPEDAAEALQSGTRCSSS
jgi:hypothetical protein